ncbi:MAG TPA: hypothetical protein VF006_09440 [Longimicrobium sp.]
MKKRAAGQRLFFPIDLNESGTMADTSPRTLRLGLATAALVAGMGVYAAPLAVRSAYATEGIAGKCSVTCNSGSRCSAEGACTCKCSLIFDIATCTCADSGSGGGGGTGPGDNMA